MVTPLDIAVSGSVSSPGSSPRCELDYREALSWPPLSRRAFRFLMQTRGEPAALPAA